MDEYIKHIRWAKLKVGIVITAALIVLFLAVMFAGNIGEIFRPRTTIYAVFHDVRGLRQDAPIWFAGIEIGKVKSMSLQKEREIRVVMSIDLDSLKYLKKDSSATIYTLGLLGDKYIELSPGTSKSPGLSKGDTLMGSTQIEFQDIIEASRDSISRASDLLKRLEGFIAMIEKGEGTLPLLLKDRALYDNLRDATRSLSNVIRKIESGKSTLGKLISDETLYTKLDASANDIKEFADNLKESDGTLNRLIKDRELYDRFLSASTSFDEFTKTLVSGKGTISRLAKDESIYENLDSASKKLNELLERLEKGEGIIGNLIVEGELYKDFKMTVKELNALIKDIKENPKKYFKVSLF